jgi:hypothetical protein
VLFLLLEGGPEKSSNAVVSPAMTSPLTPWLVIWIKPTLRRASANRDAVSRCCSFVPP